MSETTTKKTKKIVERIPVEVLAQSIQGVLGVGGDGTEIVELVAEYLESQNPKGFSKGLFRAACGLPAIG